MPHDVAVPTMKECVDLCLECRQRCKEALAQGLEKGGRQSSPAHLRALIDCAILCRASADLMTSDSPLYAKACGICAEACRRAAESCTTLDADDETLSRCAAACDRCARSCEGMSRRM